MRIIRTIIWVVIMVALVFFSYFNWKPVEVKIWDGLILETRTPALVVIAFLTGLVPMWLVHRGSKWQHQRRISSLENAARNAAAASAPVLPATSSTTVTEEVAPKVGYQTADASPSVKSVLAGNPTNDKQDPA
ncbi:DUF1049 domain-containing protein [Altererythrobacter indicus]|uniref:DUF1049 domain-containing protein n=1 Tax=Altericroceibacterium indicum TaxID=374177 RepID=A0A845A8I4_9SPHN|nr:DUF1049 domain-containing protein [Altericroceibacterium indicum]MXP24876.1 DUF1049 domain-containing protein [Altericroceibacterium indicum]